MLKGFRNGVLLRLHTQVIRPTPVWSSQKRSHLMATDLYHLSSAFFNLLQLSIDAVKKRKNPCVHLPCFFCIVRERSAFKGLDLCNTSTSRSKESRPQCFLGIKPIRTYHIYPEAAALRCCYRYALLAAPLLMSVSSRKKRKANPASHPRSGLPDHEAADHKQIEHRNLALGLAMHDPDRPSI